MANEYDVVVLGAGPGGYVAAIRAAQLGLKTAIIEKQWWGGVCLNVGCIPSKALLHNAELAHILQHRAKEFGFSFDNLELDYTKAFKRSRQTSNRLVKGVQFLMKKNKIDTYDGWGSFQDAKTLLVDHEEDEGQTTLTAKNVILAPGATTRLLPGTETSENVLTYLEVILSDTLPESIIIAGASAIGLEMSYILHNYGVDVTLVEYLPRLAPLEDEEVSKELEKAYKKLGINFRVGTRVDGVEDTGSGVKVTVTNPDDEQEVLEAQKLLQAIGMKPRTEGYGLEATGVALDERGFITVDEQMKTNVDDIYAIGDVTGKLMLAHVASAMGIIAAEVIGGHETVALDYRMMPRATYCQPQIASFGYTEQQALDAGYEINVSRFPWQANGKALGMGEKDGFVKLISDKQYGEILGGHMIGHGVTELLPELTLAQLAELTPEEIARNVHAHPTMSEAIMEAAHALEGPSINF